MGGKPAMKKPAAAMAKGKVMDKVKGEGTGPMKKPVMRKQKVAAKKDGKVASSSSQMTTSTKTMCTKKRIVKKYFGPESFFTPNKPTKMGCSGASNERMRGRNPLTQPTPTPPPATSPSSESSPPSLFSDSGGEN